MEKQNSKSDQLTITEPQKNGVKKQEQPQSIDSFISQAIASNMSIDGLEKLMAMKERYDAIEARKKFFTALAGFQSEMSKVIKDKPVSFGAGKAAYSYAPIDKIVDQARPLLFKYNLSYQFKIKDEGTNIIVTCVLTHEDGHSEETTMSGPPDATGGKGLIQQRASTITYLERYTLTGSLGITTGNDTDGKTLNTDENWQEEINKFKDYDKLRDYGNGHALKADLKFRDAVKKRLTEIQEGK